MLHGCGVTWSWSLAYNDICLCRSWLLIHAKIYRVVHSWNAKRKKAFICTYVDKHDILGVCHKLAVSSWKDCMTPNLPDPKPDTKRHVSPETSSMRCQTRDWLTFDSNESVGLYLQGFRIDWNNRRSRSTLCFSIVCHRCGMNQRHDKYCVFTFNVSHVGFTHMPKL